MRIICNLIIVIFFFLAQSTYAKDEFLSADKITYNETEEYVEANGNVKIIVDKYTIYADRVHYDLKKDEVFGYGNIKAFESGKEIILGDAILFNTKAKRAVIAHLILYFKTNDSIMAARFAEKIGDHHERLTKAVYTACPTCKTRKPLWEISAEQVDLFDDQHKVIYKNAWFKVYGVPIAYFPYFSHVTPGAPAQSGILTPRIKNKRFGMPIYWRPKSNFDATLMPAAGKKGILYEGEVRHLLSSGQYKLTGSITQSKVALSTSTLDKNAPTNQTYQRYRRYNIAGTGKFSTDHFHYGFNVNDVSDRGYLKDYYKKDIPFLVSNMYVYKTSRQNYFEVNNLHLQGLSSNDSKFTDPYVIPEVNFRYVTPLEQMQDANFSVENYSAVYSTDSLGRVSRTTLSTSLYNSYNVLGQVLGFELYNRSDLYKIQLHNQREITTGRTIPEARFSWRYPWGGMIASKMLVIEPIALMALGRNHVPSNNKFGLIDSNNYDFSDANFYKFNRYEGIDYHEYGKRITYGANSAINIRDGYRLSMFLGQFQRISKAADQRSNLVGRMSLNFFDQLELYYRFKKSPNHFESLFDEVGAWYNDTKFNLSGGYVSAHDITLPNNKGKIAQIYFDGGYNLTKQWNVGFGTRYDITDKKPHELDHSIRVTYKGDCASITTTISRNYTVDSTRDIKKSGDYNFVIGLRTLSM